MKKDKKLNFVLLFTLIGVLLASCTTATPDLSMAGTYAAQTQTAEGSDPNELENTSTIEPTEVPATSTPTKAFTSTPEPTLGPVGPSDFPEDVNPLTGLVVEDTSLLDRRPLLIKVSNYPASGRPHAGLSFADMVFEYYIGYGSNRFMALYYGQDAPQIGPVRSGRLIDPYIVTLYEGVLGFEGAYITVYNHIMDILGVRAISGEVCPAICDDGRGYVTSVFADSAALSELAEERGVENRRYTLEGMAFDPQAPGDGEPGDEASIIYSNLNRGEWRFDEASGSYLRWIEDTTGDELKMVPLTDRLTEEQLSFSNVIVLFANHTEFAETLYDVDIWNSIGQRAVVFRDGQAYDITWTTPQMDQPIQFIDEEGEIFPLKPGNTWVVIMGIYSNVTENDGSWTFNFRVP
jgi:hypothetical protein